MKSKYKLIRGLAYYEKSKMEMLSNYAKEGWVLKEVGKFFYKLEKGEPKDVIYEVDYRLDSDEEYFSLLKEAGWRSVLSINKGINILEAERGTPAIYSDKNTEVEKYKCIKKIMKKGMINTLLLGGFLGCLMYLLLSVNKITFYIAAILLYLDVSEFVIKYISYLSFTFRIRELNKYGKCKEYNNNRFTYRYIDLGCDITAIVFGIVLVMVMEEKELGIGLASIGVIGISSGFLFYKFSDNKDLEALK